MSRLSSSVQVQTATAPALEQKPTAEQLRDSIMREDPRMIALREAQDSFRTDSLKPISDRRRGALSNLENSREALEDASRFTPSGLFSRASGATGALRRQVAAESNYVSQLNDKERELTQGQSSSQIFGQRAVRLEVEGRLLETQAGQLFQQGNSQEAQRKLEQAQIRYNQAEESFRSAFSALGADPRVDTRRYSAELRGVNGELSAADQHLQRTETVLRTTRTVAIVAGATVATGGLAAGTMAVGAGVGTITAGMSTAGAVTTAVVGGTAVGTVAGGLSNATEATGHIAHGNMSAGEAFSRAGTQTLQDAQSSFGASVGTVAGIGLAGRIAGQGATVTRQVVGASAAGATNAGVSSTINNGIDVATGRRQLDGGMVIDTLQNTAVGALSAGIASRVGPVNPASVSAQGRAAYAAAEATADTGIGLGSAYARAGLEGREVTFEEITNEVGGSVIGSTVGNLAAARMRRDDGAAPSVENDRDPSRPSAPERVESESTRPAQEEGVLRVDDPDLQRILEAPSIEHERNAGIPLTGAEPELVGATVGGRPPALSAAHDGDPYNAGGTGAEPPGSGGIEPGRGEGIESEVPSVNPTEGSRPSRPSGAPTPQNDQARARLEDYRRSPESYRSHVKRARLFRELKQASKTDPELKALLRSDDPQIAELAKADKKLTTELKAITNLRENPSTRKAAELRSELKNTGLYDTLDSDTRNALDAARAADEITYAQPSLIPRGETPGEFAHNLRITIQELSYFGLEVDQMHRAIERGGEPALRHLERVHRVAWARSEAGIEETLPRELAVRSDTTEGLLAEMQTGSLRSRALTAEDISARFSRAVPAVMPADPNMVFERVYDSHRGEHQVVFRGGTLAEAEGWLSSPPDGDPRVATNDSSYTRRTGENIPVWDIEPARAAGMLDRTRDSAERYSRAEALNGQDPAASGNQVVGALIVFSDRGEVYPPSHHRNDPNWNGTEYDHVVVMEPGNRHPRAIIPVTADGTSPPGAFSMAVTPEVRALPQEVKAELFQAFRDQDRARYEQILADHRAATPG